MSREYSVYGLHVQTDAPIPALLPSVHTNSVDVRVWLNRMPSWWNSESSATDALFYRSPFVGQTGRPTLTVWELEKGGWYHLLYSDDVEFLVNPRGGEIWSRWPPGATLEDLTTYLVGPVLGFVLRFRGVCCLHASAISIGHQVIAITGPPHAGKSTTAAAFAKLGYPIVADDIVALSESDHQFLVRPGYPRLCLWPDLETPLYSAQSLPQLTPGWNKRYLDLTSDGHRFQPQSQPLSAVYLLDERQEAGDCPKVEPIPASSALVKLAANTYMNYLLDPGLRAREFPFLSRMASGLPVRRVIPHADPANLPKLCETILEDYKLLRL